MQGSLLVVDDERAVLGVLAEILRDMPVDVVTATDVEEALALARERRFGLIVSDCAVGADSGLRLLEEIGRMSGGPPVILMSGGWSEASRERAAALGAAAVWDKPVDPAALRREVAKWL